MILAEKRNLSNGTNSCFLEIFFLLVGLFTPIDMTKKDLTNWIMYHEIHGLNRLGFSISKTARYLAMDARTVNKYLQMT
jgi:hypothetical protein